jgi:hypothetical protein
MHSYDFELPAALWQAAQEMAYAEQLSLDDFVRAAIAE